MTKGKCKKTLCLGRKEIVSSYKLVASTSMYQSMTELNMILWFNKIISHPCKENTYLSMQHFDPWLICFVNYPSRILYFCFTIEFYPFDSIYPPNNQVIFTPFTLAEYITKGWWRKGLIICVEFHLHEVRAAYRSWFQVSGNPGKHQWLQSLPAWSPL